MYYAPTRPIEIEKFPKGYIKPTGQNLEFLQRQPEDNRKIQDYYGKAQDLVVHSERPQYNETANRNKDQEQQQFLLGRQQENTLKDYQNNRSNTNILSGTSAQRFESAPFNTIFTNDNVYNVVGVPEVIAQSLVQPLEPRRGIQSLRGTQRGYIHDYRGFAQVFQEPNFYVKDSRDVGQQGFGWVHPEYRSMTPPGILNEQRSGIPEAIFHKRNQWREGRRDFGYRVFPIRDYQKMSRLVDYGGAPIILNERNIFPQDYGGAAYLNSERLRYEPQFDYEMHRDPRAVPIPDYYVPEYGRNSGIWREREFKDGMNQGNQKDWVYPSSYGKIGQQMQREGIQDYQSQEGRRY